MPVIHVAQCKTIETKVFPNQFNLFNEYKLSYAMLLGNGCDYTLFGHKPTKDQRTAGTVPHNMSVSRSTMLPPFQ